MSPAAINQVKTPEAVKTPSFHYWVQSLVRELRPHKLCGVAEGKQTNTTPGELRTFNGRIVWCENNFSIQLLSKQSKTRTEHQIFLILKQFQLSAVVWYCPSCPGLPALAPPPRSPRPPGPFRMCTEHLLLSFGLLPLTQPSGPHPYLPRAAHGSIFPGQKAVCPKRHPGTSCQDNNSFQPAT